MPESVNELRQEMGLSELIARLVTDAQCPEFPPGGMSVKEAAQVFGKDQYWIRQGIIDGWLPIGYAQPPRNGGNRLNFYISPKKVWEITGYVWKGKTGNFEETA